MKISLIPAAAIALLGLLPLPGLAARLTATDLDSLNLGARIVGPVGPEVETTFINRSGEAIGDFSSSVACPGGFTSCDPSTNPAGTIYTYIHTVTPGVDFPNDAPFPSPNVVLPVDNARLLRLGFEAIGFNGVAGYSFGDANTVLGDAAGINITHTRRNRLTWRAVQPRNWNQSESISFFWQTTQAPIGPGGIYRLNAQESRGFANGPLPAPLNSTQVPEPGAITALSLLGAAIIWKKRQVSSAA